MNPRILHFVLLGVMVLFIVGIAFYRSTRERPAPKNLDVAGRVNNAPADRRPPSEPAEKPKPLLPEDARKQGVALHDATLVGLIENARMAEQRGDIATRDAMVSGLKKSPERSKELIAKQMQSARDPAAVSALQALIERIR